MKTVRPVLVALMLGACGGATSTGANTTAPDASSGASSGASAPAPYPIACTVYRRDRNSPSEFIEAKLDFSSDVDGPKSATLQDLHIEGALEAIAGAPDDVLFKISVVETKVTHEARLRRRELPPFGYIGDHGFAGLFYVPTATADVQYICVAGDKSTVRVGGAEDVPAPLPVRARCSVRGPAGEEQTLDIDGPGSKQVAFADATVGALVFDEEYEGRSIVLAIGDANVPRTEQFQVKQLLQIARERRLVNLFGVDHGFSGRVSATLPSGGVVSYACATAD